MAANDAAKYLFRLGLQHLDLIVFCRLCLSIKPLQSSCLHVCVCVCANLQLCGRHQGSSEDHDPSGDHGLRARPLPARSAGGVHGQAGLPVEAAGQSACALEGRGNRTNGCQHKPGVNVSV